ncbi:MAG: matrixin family metalloprotease [bacterium]|nr:matrixin family metalloprotease [bacterium]
MQTTVGLSAGLVEDLFDKDGLLISHMVGGSEESEPFTAEFKKGRLVDIRYSPSPRGNAPATTPLKYDSQGRATALREKSFNGADVLVRTVRYEPARQLHDIYKNRSLLLSVAFNFSAHGNLSEVQCLAGDCANFVDLKFGGDGILSSRSAAVETAYRYKDGLLSEKTTVYKSRKQAETVYYGDYKIDDCGNWTQQAVFDQPPSNAYRQRTGLVMRQLDYHSACEPVRQPVSSLTCPSVLSYRIGSVDPRFGLSAAQFRAAVDEAAALWNKKAGRKLLLYRDDGVLPINLVYDERQVAAHQMRGVSENFAAVKEDYADMHKQYEAALAVLDEKNGRLKEDGRQYEKEVGDIKRAAQELDNDARRYKDKVAAINLAGGAPREEAAAIETWKRELLSRQEALQSRQKILQREYERLQAGGNELNALASQANALADKLNGSSARMDSLKKEFNRNRYAGAEFEAGVYKVVGEKRWIDIYSLGENALEPDQDLKLKLAHEFGHALGFAHVQAPDAVMYYKTGLNAFKLSSADVALLAKQCPLQ